ncbi:MAG TPA: 2,4-dienoyl-CoA reductase [Blastocatellia bacterium]|nr:2,4-dienoyl-CoA reductase [Blastocatellia bacterium]
MFADKVLKGRVAIITGGGTGIGKAIAEKYGNLGANIVIASRNPEHTGVTVEELRSNGINAIATQTDVRDPASIDEMVKKTLEAFGRIDILVNNAAGNFVCPTEQLSINGWNSVINIVLNGTFYCSRAIGLEMIKQKSGKILNIVATYAWTGNPGTIHSACAKAGVTAMTQTLAVEWARHNIRVNAIAPGITSDTGAASQLWGTPEAADALRRQVPLQRFASPEEIANAAAYLVSDYADYINGEVLVIDGGSWLNHGTFADVFVTPKKS